MIVALARRPGARAVGAGRAQDEFDRLRTAILVAARIGEIVAQHAQHQGAVIAAHDPLDAGCEHWRLRRRQRAIGDPAAADICGLCREMRASAASTVRPLAMSLSSKALTSF